MKILISRRSDALILGGIMLVMAVIWLVPILSALNRSLVFNGIENYISVLTEPIGGITIYRTFLNSAIIALGHATLVLGISSLAGFAFGKLDFPYRNVIFYLAIITLAVPGTAIIVPLFRILDTIGLLDTYLAVILPETALTLPFGVLLMRNYFGNLPDEYMESATIDGASTFQVFRRIYLPLARPALIPLGVLAIMWSFQDFLLPLMFITDPELTTAAMAVSSFQEYLSFTPDNIGKYNAALVLLAVPALVLIVFGQRFITQGLTSGGIKE
jgi:raffinose/stachyose/melibiose transport system permease protein